MIERLCPCADEYHSFLHDFKGHPVSGGDYWSDRYTGEEPTGVDTPIPLREILQRKSRHGVMNGAARIVWLIERDCIYPNGFRQFVEQLADVEYLVEKLATLEMPLLAQVLLAIGSPVRK